MSRIPKWFERKFPQTTSADAFPNLICRLRGTPPRLEELLQGLPRQALTAADGAWSIQENAGHLIDLESLWDQRLSDFLAGDASLTAADLSNRATDCANHNARDPGELLVTFRRVRTAFVDRLRGLAREDFERTANHPRLGIPMRLVDHLAFIAEHDDHHLARINELREKAAPGE